MRLAVAADEKTPMARPVSKEILDSWFSNEYRPNPEDDEALRQIDELESTYRSGRAGNPVESRTR
jgi:hypothetical protein